MIKHIILDLDGVIIDSKKNMEVTWLKTCNKHDLEIPFKSYFKLIGLPFITILNNLDITNNHNKIEKTYMDFSIKNFNNINFFKNVIKTLKVIEKKGIILSIVTSKDKIRTKLIVSKIPVKFSSVISPSKKFRGKPAPDQLLYAVAVANRELYETVYIGDTIIDFQTAKRSSVKYIHANYGYGKNNLSNFLNINVFNEIEDIL